jgi:predicted transposase/invertase (TIGR01784 family)
MAKRKVKPTKESNEYDNVFKEKFNNNSLQLIRELLDEKFTNIVITKPTDFTRNLRKADFVYLVEENGVKEVFHLEVQTKEDIKMIQRMYLYSAFLYNEYIMPVKQVVLYLGENKTPNQANLGYFDYNYKVIYIKEIPYESFLNDSENLVFAILADFGEDNLQTVLKNIFKVASKYFTNNKNFAELAENIEKLGKLRELENEINILIPTFMPFDIDFRDTPTWKKAKQEGVQETEFAIAKTMLIKGFNIIQVQDATGLTLEQIQALEKEINP